MSPLKVASISHGPIFSDVLSAAASASAGKAREAAANEASQATCWKRRLRARELSVMAVTPVNVAEKRTERRENTSGPTVVPLAPGPRRLAVQMLLQQPRVLAVRLPHEVEHIAEEWNCADHEIDADIAEHAGERDLDAPVCQA